MMQFKFLMKLLFLCCFLFFNFFYCISACNGLRKIDEENTFINLNDEDLLFQKQKLLLNNCTRSLPNYERIYQLELEKLWTKNAVESIKLQLNDEEKYEYFTHNFSECLSFLSSNKVNSLYCNKIAIVKHENDRLSFHAKLDYEKCIDRKNKQSAIEINYDLPVIGPLY